MDYITYSKRLDYLFESIKKEKLESPQQLAEKFECSEKTIRNMVNVLRDNGAEIIYCKATKKYLLKGDCKNISDWMQNN